jgi:hypothetical protein
MNPLSNFIPWILVVQLQGLPALSIEFSAFGPFNSQKCLTYEAIFRQHGLAANCTPEVAHD